LLIHTVNKKIIDNNINFPVKKTELYNPLKLRFGSSVKDHFSMKIDEINLTIIKHLRDGRKPLKKIAQELSLTENTVRARVNKLVAEGVIEITGLVDPESIPGHKVVMVGVKLQSMDLIRKGEEFSRLRGVVSVSVVTGQFDLFLVVLLKEGFGLLEFYTEEVAKIKDVRSVETFVVYKGYGLKVPYIL
jgi:Lrp/AsnC family transcriptional regulator, regulator for asnA, asnC and gidA